MSHNGSITTSHPLVLLAISTTKPGLSMHTLGADDGAGESKEGVAE